MSLYSDLVEVLTPYANEINGLITTTSDLDTRVTDLESSCGSSTLAGLTDTDISNKVDGQVLTYDSSKSKWVNKAPIGGGSVTVDSALSDTSTNPIQNKVIKQALDNKAGISVATTSANGLMSSTDKQHLDAVYADYSAAITALGA